KSIIQVSIDRYLLWLMRQTKFCTGLQGFVRLWSATGFDDKKISARRQKSPCANALLQVTNTI
ncbi:hypothetical protein ACSGMT_004052, partial [Escherichia coli]